MFINLCLGTLGCWFRQFGEVDCYRVVVGVFWLVPFTLCSSGSSAGAACRTACPWAPAGLQGLAPFPSCFPHRSGAQGWQWGGGALLPGHSVPGWSSKTNSVSWKLIKIALREEVNDLLWTAFDCLFYFRGGDRNLAERNPFTGT